MCINWQITYKLSKAFRFYVNSVNDFANTSDPDETAHDEPSDLDLQFLPSSL